MQETHGFDPWVWKIPWMTKWQPSPVFLSGEPHGQKSLVDYGSWGCKESDVTGGNLAHTHTHIPSSLVLGSELSAPATLAGPRMYQALEF